MTHTSVFETAELDAAQRTVLEHFAHSDLAEHFTLTGGTALGAFHLHHRHSEDLDLFADHDVPLSTIDAYLKSVPGLEIGSFHRRYDRKIFTTQVRGQPLKIEFTKFPFERVCGRNQVDEGLWVDSPNEILVNKLLAIADRCEPKDDVDIYFLLRAEGAPSLLEALILAERKFGIVGLRHSLQSRFLAVPAQLPNTTPPVSREDVVAAFKEEVKRLVAAFAVG
jgi:predicted nucleotidyltransferase component of viral defense system